MQENIKNKYWTKDCILQKKVVHRACEFIENKIAGAVTMSNNNNIEKEKLAEEIIIPTEKREEISSKLRKVL